MHPEVYSRIRADRELLAPALEEVLRWEPPAQAINASTALENLEVDGKVVHAGESVSVLVGAANRDPRIFKNPDQFLIDRNPNPHLSFAPGLHQCLGLHLQEWKESVSSMRFAITMSRCVLLRLDV